MRTTGHCSYKPQQFCFVCLDACFEGFAVVTVLAEAGSTDAAPLLLGKACLSGVEAHARAAVAAGADVNAATFTVAGGMDGDLTAADVARNSLSMLAVLVEMGSTDAPPLLLGVASSRGDEARVREALAAGADANATAYKEDGQMGGDMTAAAVAARCRHLGVLAILAEGSEEAAAEKQKLERLPFGGGAPFTLSPGDFNTGKAKPAPTFTFSFDGGGGGGGESSVAAPFKTVFSFGDAAPAAAVDDVGPAFCSRFVDACSIPLPEEDSDGL